MWKVPKSPTTAGNKPIASQRVSAPQLREVYNAEEESLVERRVNKNVPEELISELADCLRVVLERFIDPKTDRIGHAFQLNKYSGGSVSIRADGLKQVEYTSPLQEFADALVQAAAVIGIQEAMRLLEAWKRGEPIQSRICTVLNNLFIGSAIHPREGVEVVPLPLTTDKLRALAVWLKCFSRRLSGTPDVVPSARRVAGILSPEDRATQKHGPLSVRW